MTEIGLGIGQHNFACLPRHPHCLCTPLRYILRILQRCSSQIVHGHEFVGSTEL
jgi:hypothetical protein